MSDEATQVLRLFNTLTRRVEAFVPARTDLVTFYSCGPTVYDDAHIGNFRSFLAADVLRRFIESPLCVLRGPDGAAHAGPRRVVHVMNITDVGHMTDDDQADGGGEDKMAAAGRRLSEAKKAGTLPAGVDVNPADPAQIARFYEARFREDARKLGLKVSLEAEADPTLHPRATENVEGMIALIQRLVDRGHAYAVGTPGSRVVYFRVRSFARYGRLSGNTLDQLKEGQGGRVSDAHQAQKEHPADFLLWKEDAAHVMKWPSPWGVGYPGWHIECTVMSAARLGAQAASGAGPLTPAALTRVRIEPGQSLIDLHSGGEDNIFPHHECELAQTCCGLGDDPAGAGFARLWFHPRFLLVEGTKMSKRTGNFFTARDLFARGIEPAALRLELIRTHYRANANFTMQGLTDAQRMIDRWRRVAAAGQPGEPPARRPDSDQAGAGAADAAPGAEARAACRRAFAAALHEDLNVAAAVAAVNSFVGAAPAPRAEDAALVRELDAVLAVLDRPRPESASSGNVVYLPGAAPSDAVTALVNQRAAAKAARDFAGADALRAQILALGYAVKDVPGGRVEVSRAP